MFRWFRRLFSQKRKLVQIVAFLLVLVLVGVGGKIFYDRFITKAEEGPVKKGTIGTKFVSNQILIKFNEDGIKKLKKKDFQVTIDDTGIEKINQLNKDFKVKKFEKVFKDGPNDDTLDRWYLVEFKGEKKIIQGNPENQKATIENNQKFTINDLVRLYSNEDTELIQPNFISEVSLIPNDTYYSSNTLFSDHDDLWGLKKIQTSSAWDQTTGNNVVVAIIDTGVDYTHPDLQNNMYTLNNSLVGYDYANNDSDPMDDHAHGTHVAGTIAAVGNNDYPRGRDSGKRLVGVGWNLKIMPIKFLDANGSGSDDGAVQSFKFAADNGAKVINNSWGGPPESQILSDAINYAYQKNIVVIFAAGNENTDVLYSGPAGNPNVITVGATNYLDQRACFSNFGERIDLVAPGGDVTSCGGKEDYILSAKSKYANSKYSSLFVGQYYMKMMGTSMAAPHVSGGAALILSKYPNLTNEQVRSLLKNSAEPLGGGWNSTYGAGRLNLNRALNTSTPPVVVKFNMPEYNYFIKDNFKIYGSVNSPQGYNVTWKLSATPKNPPYQWQVVATGNGPINGLLSTISGFKTGDYLLKLEGAGPSSSSQTYMAAFYDGDVLTGWPKELGSGSTHPAIADINNDGKNEIILGQEDIKVIKNDGTSISGFPFRFPVEGPWSFYAGSPAIADINKDGKREIVFIGTRYLGDQNYLSKLWVLSDSGQPLTGWPVEVKYAQTPQHSYVVPTLADLNGDGYLEILLKTVEGNIFVYKSDGSFYSGWPRSTTSRDSGLFKNSPVATGDLDQDGKLEILAAMSGSNTIYVFKENGQLLQFLDWPYATEVYQLAVGVADINGDGKLEIIGKGDIVLSDTTVVAWDAKGTESWRKDMPWPADCWEDWDCDVTIGGPDFANLTSDPGLEIIIPTYSTIVMLNGKGQDILGSPVQHSNIYSTSLAVSSDGAKATFYGGVPRGFGAANTDGQSVFSRFFFNYSTYEAPAIGDIDNDGKVEIVANVTPHESYSPDKTFIWKTNVDVSGKSVWPQYLHDERHSGISNLQPFADVKPTDPYYKYIMSLYEKGITVGNNCPSGYPAGSKCYYPDNNTTRVEMALFLTRAANLPLYSGSEQPFADVPTTHQWYKEIMTIYKAGITSGCSTNPLKFCPDQTVTRAQTAIFLQRAAKLMLYSGTEQPFADVPVTYPVYKQIMALYKAGGTDGCSSNPLKYCPDGLVPRKVMAKFLTNTFKIPLQ